MKQWKQFPLWLNHDWWRAGGVNAPPPSPPNPDRDAGRRWENEGGNPPLTEPPNENPRRHAIEFLAREAQVPVDEVAQLYEDARTKLEVGARIKGFLGIFAIRNVRTTLRRRNGFRRFPAPRAEAAGRTPS
jgi:hypothetical protein